MSAPRKLWSKRNLYRWAPYIGGSVLVVGVAAFLITFYGNTAETSPPPIQRTGPADLGDQPGKVVKVSSDVQKTAARFIKTAVARKDLATGWKITHPDLRSGTSYKEWMRGTSTVIPYPVDTRVPPAFRVDESYERRAELEVILSPKKGSGVKSQIFFIGLKAVGNGQKKHWLVYYWAPRSVAPVQQADLGG
jgi:hypothetical protein